MLSHHQQIQASVAGLMIQWFASYRLKVSNCSLVPCCSPKVSHHLSAILEMKTTIFANCSRVIPRSASIFDAERLLRQVHQQFAANEIGMEFKKHCEVPSKGAIMGIMGLQSLNFKRLTFKYGFSLFDLILLVILPFFHMVSRICRWSFSLFYRQQSLCFTCSQCTKAPVQWPTVPPLVDLTSHVRNAFKPLNPKTKKWIGPSRIIYLLKKKQSCRFSLLVGDLWVLCQD